MDFNPIEHVVQGVAVWNAWRKNNPDVEIDFSSIKELSGTNLQEIDFRDVDLGDAELNNTDFSHSRFESANLSGANLTNANFREAILLKVSAENTNFRRADLSKAKLNVASLRNSDLSGADLSSCSLYHADLFGTNLQGANLSRANLSGADFRKADCRGAYFGEANLSEADFEEANLSKAYFNGAYIFNTNFHKADLRQAYFHKAKCFETDLSGANLEDCYIHEFSTWKLDLRDTIQNNLVISHHNQPLILVDSLKVAEFIGALQHNTSFFKAVESTGFKIVLILGDFKEKQKVALQVIRNSLLNKQYNPVYVETKQSISLKDVDNIMVLARFSHFIITDNSTTKNLIPTLEKIAFSMPSVPIQQISSEASKPEKFILTKDFSSVTAPYLYPSIDDLRLALEYHLIESLQKKVKALSSDNK